jgi:glucose-6-phosphate 1-epimerase
LQLYVLAALDQTPSIADKWKQPFYLEYLVTISNHELGTKLHVTNPSTSDSVLKYQALLHNYIAAPASKVIITPLTGLKYNDKIQGGIQVLEERQEVDVIKATDSVYPSAPGTYNVKWPGAGLNIKTTGFPDVVIWNPNEEIGKGIGDLEERGWYVYRQFVAIFT